MYCLLCEWKKIQATQSILIVHMKKGRNISFNLHSISRVLSARFVIVTRFSTVNFDTCYLNQYQINMLYQIFTFLWSYIIFCCILKYNFCSIMAIMRSCLRNYNFKAWRTMWLFRGMNVLTSLVTKTAIFKRAWRNIDM